MDTQRKASFEQNFGALERVVEALEKEGLTLDDAIALFEQGMRLAKSCNEQLESAELRIARLRTGLSGQVVEETESNAS